METGLTLVKENTQDALPKKPLELFEPIPPNCEICWDTGMEALEGGSRICECRLRRIREAKHRAIPAKFADVRLATLKPRHDLHPLQSEIVPAMRELPAASYFLAGDFGTGKSMMMWALYRNAVDNNFPKVVCCTLAELLNEFRAFIQASVNHDAPKPPRLNAEDLRQNHTRYSIFLDDIDKARPTEYAAEQFFEIVNAVYEYQHQIVVTTNLSAAKLVEHFDRADFRFGGAIVRRLVDDARVVEMF